MTMKVYFDTNIYINYLRGESSYFRPVSEYASNAFKSGIGCEYFIVFSDHVAEELDNKGFTKQDIKDVLDWIGEKVIIVKYKKEHKKITRKILHEYKGVHYADALHYAIADSSADLLLTEDKEMQVLPKVVTYETL